MTKKTFPEMTSVVSREMRTGTVSVRIAADHKEVILWHTE